MAHAAWMDFERGHTTEEDLFRDFFKDGRPINGSGMLQAMVCLYAVLALHTCMDVIPLHCNPFIECQAASSTLQCYASRNICAC